MMGKQRYKDLEKQVCFRREGKVDIAGAYVTSAFSTADYPTCDLFEATFARHRPFLRQFDGENKRMLFFISICSQAEAAKATHSATQL